MSRLQPSAVALAVVFLAMPINVAVGDSDGVTVDPNSPAGTEYAIPIQQARHQGDGKTGAGNKTGLFGAGITSTATSGSTNSAGATPHSTAPKSKRHQKKRARGKTGNEATGRLVSKESGGDSGILVVVICGAVALLLIAALGGRFLRRRFTA